ncbi:MAG: histidine phosphatase family protein [Anaerolineae bacterium]|nr:histidine phosphatase family protein [Anaerolineae bacterium]
MFQSLAVQHLQGHLLIVTHTGVHNIIITYLRRGGLLGLVTKPVARAPCAITEIEFDAARRGRVLTFNDTSHFVREE